MRVPLSWLREFVDVRISPEELAERLTLGGLEVEGLEYIGVEAPADSPWAPRLNGPPPEHIPWDRERVLVGELLEVRQHPNADRLSVPVVGYGEGRVIELVTGAPNVRVGMQGQKVALALAGARLIDGHSEERRWLTLKPSKIRGVPSQGMVCSELELGLSEEHEGILFLPDDAPVGTPLADYMGEIVFDIDVTPNMARALSIVGIAREVAALTGEPLRLPEVTVQQQGAPVAGRVAVEIADPQLCPRYVAGLIEGLRIGPSPRWMQWRLRLAGMRPVNNIVDITNYVMLEWGQPLHAFDAARVSDQQIIVRAARPGERLETIDHQLRDLGAMATAPLLICDPRGPIAIAGVMGGAESEVSDQTSDVILESATFDPVSIRRTSNALKLPSEASRRFERGVDPELPPLAARRALELMRQLAGGSVAQGLVDVYPRPAEQRHVSLPASEVTRLLGITLTAQEIATLLQRLEFECRVTGQHVEAAVPSYRLDVSIPADLVEEVARLYGYDRLPSTLLADVLPPQRNNPVHQAVNQVRAILTRTGLDEAISYAFTNLTAAGRIHAEGGSPKAERYLRLANPLTPERELLRQSLLPELLHILGHNLREQERVAMFEIGAVYLPVDQEQAAAGQNEPGALPLEQPQRLAIVLAGLRAGRSWREQAPPPMDFFDLKGVVEVLLERLGLQEQVAFVPAPGDDRFHPGRSARLVLLQRQGRELVEQQTLGVLGEVHPLVRERLELRAPRAMAAELDLDALIALQTAPHYAPISRFPATLQDIAVLAPSELPAAQIATAIRQGGGQLLESVELFDVYEGPPVPVGQRSLAFRLRFRAPDRTLSDQEVNKQREKLVRRLQQELNVTIRA